MRKKKQIESSQNYMKYENMNQ